MAEAPLDDVGNEKGPDKDASKKPSSREGEPSGTSWGIKRVLSITLAALLVGVVALIWVGYSPPSPGEDVSFDRFYELAEANKLQSVRFLDEDAVIVGRACQSPPEETPAPAARPARCYDRLTESFHAAYPSSQVSTQQLIDVIRSSSGAKISIDKQTHIAVARLLSTVIFPLLMLANLFGLIFLSRAGGDSSMDDIANFGRIGNKGKGQAGQAAPITFANVAGAEEAVVELREVIDYLADPSRFAAYGASPPKGVLLFGPPGCGKTLLARATAGESGVAFISAAGTEFVESLVGVGAARVRDLFRQVREMAPAILFVDEIDAVGRRRSGEGSSGGEREQTLNQLLVELDGFEVSSGVVIMGATNRPDILDPALMRPGRFDRHITLSPPNIAGRTAILQLHARGRPLGADVDLGSLAHRTAGFSGADLSNVLNEGALLAIRQGPGTPISAAILSEAVLRVVHGTQRRGRILSDDERHRLAVHEAGHALVATALGQSEEVQRVSILARGRALAQSTVSSGDERALLTYTEMQAQLAMAMSGTAAEVLVLGESSTTAHDDIAKATALARDMAGLYGMSPKLGRMLLISRADSYLGSEDATLEMVSGPTMAAFDDEVRRLLCDAEAHASAVLKANQDRFVAFVEALERTETLEGSVLAGLLSGLDGSTAFRPASPVGRANGSRTAAPPAWAAPGPDTRRG